MSQEELAPEVAQPEVADTEKKSKKPKSSQKEKSTEEKVMEGVGYWTRMCESQGDFETPQPADPDTAQKEQEMPSTSDDTSQKDVKLQVL